MQQLLGQGWGTEVCTRGVSVGPGGASQALCGEVLVEKRGRWHQGMPGDVLQQGAGGRLGLVRWERGAIGFGSSSEAAAPSLRLAAFPSCSLGSGGEALVKARLSLGAVTVLVRLSSPRGSSRVRNCN